MALSTLLDMVQRATGELGLPSSALTVIGSPDKTFVQMGVLANSVGRDIARQHEWGALNAIGTITTVVDQSDYALPSGFYSLTSDTTWDRANKLPVGGPQTPQMDRALREGIIEQNGIRRQVRLIGNRFLRIWPTPLVDGEVVAFEYASKNWALSAADSAPQPEFAADGDTTVFDPDLMVKELKWRFLSAKGMDFQQAQIESRVLLNQLIAADIGGTILNMGGSRDGDCGGEVFAGQEPNYIYTDNGENLEWD